MATSSGRLSLPQSDRRRCRSVTLAMSWVLSRARIWHSPFTPNWVETFVSICSFWNALVQTQLHHRQCPARGVLQHIHFLHVQYVKGVSVWEEVTVLRLISLGDMEGKRTARTPCLYFYRSPHLPGENIYEFDAQGFETGDIKVSR